MCLEGTHEFFAALERHIFKDSQVVDIIDDSKAPAAGEIEVADSKGKNMEVLGHTNM